MRDYRSKEVMGYMGGIGSDGEEKIAQCKVRVRMTSDEIGKTLSLTAEDNDFAFQIGIPLESVRDIIRIYNDRGGYNGKK